MSDGTVYVLPNIEAIVVDFLLATPEVNTIDDRIVTVVPARPVFPLIRVTRIGGNPTSRLLWLDQATLQVDVWGGPKNTARDIAETARAHLSASLPGPHDGGAVTAVEVGGLTWLPDESYDPAKPRYSFDLAVYYHP